MARDWLSPEDYQRLSPAERQQLWAERKIAGHRRRFQRPRPQRRMPRWSGRLVMLSVMFFAVGAYTLGSDKADSWGSGSVGLADAPDGERVHFGTCVWGGGRNCVVDGDTFYLHGEKIRIAGIDAPETHDFGCPAEKELGDRATVRLRELLNSGPLTLSNIDRDRDVYGRLLRNVAVNGEDVGEVLVHEQLARKYLGRKLPWC